MGQNSRCCGCAGGSLGRSWARLATVGGGARRERDLVAPRVTEVILPPQEREVFFRDTVVVNRTVVLQDRRFGVNPGIPPTYIAAAYGRPIPSYQISPRVFAGTANLPGAVVVRADDFRNRERVREIARESTFVRQTTNTVAGAGVAAAPAAWRE